MPNTWEDIYRAKLETQQVTTEAEVHGLPPGYIKGGELSLNNDYQVEITALTANVAGREVRIGEDTTLNEEHWNIIGVDIFRTQGFYYVYLYEDGTLHVAHHKPTYNTTYHAYYHPEYDRYRAIGKFYVGEDLQISYAQTGVKDFGSQVVVASSTYEGPDANYKCTGTDDHLIIQAAIMYLHDAYDGGTVELTEGTFETNDQIDKSYDNIWITGRGAASTINRNNTGSHGIYCVGSSGSEINGGGIRDLKITTAVDTSSYNHLHFVYADDLVVSGVHHISSDNYSVYCENCDNATIDNNYFNDAYLADVHYKDSTGKISGNTIDGTGYTRAESSYGIEIVDNGDVIVTRNYIHDISGSKVVNGILIRADRCVVSGNQVRDLSTTDATRDLVGIYLGATDNTVTANNYIAGCSNSGDSARAYGIRIGPTSTESLLVGNYCYDNGDDTNTISNTNENNFSDLDTADTHTSGNSWQQPVSGVGSLGTPHYYQEGSATSTLVNAVNAPSSTWSAAVTVTGCPVGSKAAILVVKWRWTDTTGNAGQGNIYFGNATSTAPAYSKAFPRLFWQTFAAAANREEARGETLVVPLNSSREFRYYWAIDIGIATSTLWVADIGYYI